MAMMLMMGSAASASSSSVSLLGGGGAFAFIRKRQADQAAAAAAKHFRASHGAAHNCRRTVRGPVDDSNAESGGSAQDYRRPTVLAERSRPDPAILANSA